MLDVVEQQVIQKIESEWSWQGGELINSLRAYSQRLIGYSVQSEYTNLRIVAKDTLSKLQAANHRAEAELGPLKDEYVGHRNDLLDFRRAHRLRRVAQLPARRWTTFGLLTIFIAFESVLNGVFFAKGSEFGLVGGIGIAIGLSLFNVLFAFILGMWPARWINSRNWLVKIFASLVTSGGVCAIVLLHGFAAHYRDAVAAVGEANALNQAWSTLITGPWILGDINSYYLFGLGLLFAFAAFYKGYAFDDPYPYYGKLSRAAAGARDDYSDVHAELFDELERIKDDTIGALADGITRIPLFPQQAANIRAQRNALIQTFRGYEGSIISASNQLLSQYRDENRKARLTAAPKHFDRAYILPHSFIESVEVRQLTADYMNEEVNVQPALEELRALSQEVIDRYLQLLVAYPHPTKMDAGSGA